MLPPTGHRGPLPRRRLAMLAIAGTALVVFAASCAAAGDDAGANAVGGQEQAAAVGSDDSTADTATAATGDVAVETSGPEVATDDDGAVLGPVFETVSGSTFDLGSIEGTDTLLWFWAPW